MADGPGNAAMTTQESGEIDEDSIMGLNSNDEFCEGIKRKALELLTCMIAATSTLGEKQTKTMCAGKTIHTAARCKAAFMGNLKRLKRRFERTTTAKYGKAAFEDDLMQLVLNLEDVCRANLYGSIDIRYRTYVPRKCVPKLCY